MQNSVSKLQNQHIYQNILEDTRVFIDKVIEFCVLDVDDEDWTLGDRIFIKIQTICIVQVQEKKEIMINFMPIERNMRLYNQFIISDDGTTCIYADSSDSQNGVIYV